MKIINDRRSNGWRRLDDDGAPALNVLYLAPVINDELRLARGTDADDFQPPLAIQIGGGRNMRGRCGRIGADIYEQLDGALTILNQALNSGPG